MKAALDFWSSKTTLLFVGTALTVAGDCLMRQGWPTPLQWQLLIGTAATAFMRDTKAKIAQGRLPNQIVPPGAVNNSG
jgi:hypothetical protein